MVEDHDEERLTDDDIQAAVRYWLNSNTWKTRLRHNLIDLSPGVLRSLHEELPDMLLEMGKHEGFSTEANLFEEAWSALEYSDYAGHGQGETLTKTISSLRRALKEYVDKRMQEVFEPEALTVITNSGVPASSTPANMSNMSTFIAKWQSELAAGYNGNKKLTSETTDQYLRTVELFIGLMGDLPIGKITYEQAADYREKLLE